MLLNFVFFLFNQVFPIPEYKVQAEVIDSMLESESEIFSVPYQIPAVPYQFSFQEPATPVMNGLLDLHDYVFFFIIVILSVVLLLLFQVVSTFALREIFFFKADDISPESNNIFPSTWKKGLSTREFSFSYIFLAFSSLITWLFKGFKGLFALYDMSFLKLIFRKGKKRTLKKDLSPLFVHSFMPSVKNKTSHKFILLNDITLSDDTLTSIVNSGSKDVISKVPFSNLVSQSTRLLKNSFVSPSSSIPNTKNSLTFLFGLKQLLAMDLTKSEYIFSVLRNVFPNSFFLLSNTIKTSNSLLSSFDSGKVFIYEDSYYEFLNSSFPKLNLRSNVSNMDNDSIFFSNLLTSDSINSYLFSNLVDVNQDRNYIDDEYIFNYTDYIRNLDYVLNVFKSKTDNDIFSNALISSLINANNESLKLHNGSSFFTNSPTKLSNNIVLEPFWFDFPYDISWKGADLHISDNDQDKVSGETGDLEINNVLDIVLSNIVHHLFVSKYKQRFDFILRTLSGLFSFSPDIKSYERLDIALLDKSKTFSHDDSKAFSASLFIGDSYLTSLFSSRFIKLHHLLKIGYFNHSTRLEIIWTLIPIFIIALIITPSFFFMYAIDEDMESLLTVRVIGHQWFWSYVYSFPSYDFSSNNHFFIENKNLSSLLEARNYSFDSYMLDDLSNGAPRLLATDSVLVLPKYSHINCVVTSSDVLHSWALPSLGVKIDAVPGRLNRVDLFIEHEGMFFGQCSELCGVNHAFMPIQIEAVSLSDFFDFILKNFK